MQNSSCWLNESTDFDCTRQLRPLVDTKLATIVVRNTTLTSSIAEQAQLVATVHILHTKRRIRVESILPPVSSPVDAAWQESSVIMSKYDQYCPFAQFHLLLAIFVTSKTNEVKLFFESPSRTLLHRYRYR